MTIEDDISEYDEKIHQPITSLDEVEIGDRLGNWAVGECRLVEKRLNLTSPISEAEELVVSYKGLHTASGEERKYLHAGPVGSTNNGRPFFWKRRAESDLLAEVSRLRAELAPFQETYRIEVRCPEYGLPDWSPDAGWSGVKGLEAARIACAWAYEMYGYKPYQTRIVRESDNVVVDE